MAFLAGERAADEVEALLRDAADRPAILAINLAEAIDVLVRAYGQPPQVVDEKLEWLVAGGLDVLEVDDVMARAAGSVRATRYHRSRALISLADAFVVAGAALLGARVATADGPLASVARAEGVEVVALPDSSGRRPVA